MLTNPQPPASSSTCSLRICLVIAILLCLGLSLRALDSRRCDNFVTDTRGDVDVVGIDDVAPVLVSSDTSALARLHRYNTTVVRSNQIETAFWRLNHSVVYVSQHAALEWQHETRRVLIVCVCFSPERDAAYQAYYHHVQFMRIPDLVEQSVVHVVDRQRCAHHAAEYSNLAHTQVLLVACSISDRRHWTPPDSHLNGTLGDALLLPHALLRDPGYVAPPMRHRPVHVQIAGEVFYAHGYACHPHEQVAVYRATDVAVKNCFTVHYVQLAHLMFGHYPYNFGVPSLMPRVRARTRAEAERALAEKERFAAYAFGKFDMSIYYGDFVTRHVFVHMLTQKMRSPLDAAASNQIDALGHFSLYHPKRSCPGGYWEEPKCFRPYKFAIVMENSQLSGYISEKFMNAYLADSVPVYFGASDVTKYLNAKAMVHCRITDAEVAKLREAFKQKYAFLSDHAPLAVVEWAQSHIASSLQPCVDQVAYLHANDTAYVEMLMQHPLATRQLADTWLDGFYSSCAFVEVLARLQSPFLDNLQHAAWRQRCAKVERDMT